MIRINTNTASARFRTTNSNLLSTDIDAQTSTIRFHFGQLLLKGDTLLRQSRGKSYVKGAVYATRVCLDAEVHR